MAATAAATPEAPLNVEAEPAPVKVKGKPGPKYTAQLIRSRVGTYLGMRALEPSISNSEVARRMCISTSTLNHYLVQARREGWLTFSDPLARMEYEVIPKVMDNLVGFLDAKDKQVTIEAAKGTVFKMFQEAKGISEAPKTVLALKIEMPPSSEDTPRSGVIVGVPRMLDPSDSHHDS